MTNEQKQQVLGCIAKASGADAATIGPETTFASLDATSMVLIALLADIENEFDIEITLQEASAYQTVQELLDRVDAELD